MAQKIFDQINFRCFRRTLAPTRLRDHEFPIIFLHTLWRCCLNVKILNNPELEDFCWTICINKYVQLPAKNAKSRSRKAECERRCPNVAEDTRTSAETADRSLFFRNPLDTDTIDTELEKYNINMLNPAGAVNTLQCIIKTATVDSTPSTVIKPKKSQGKIRWTPEIAKAVKTSKEKHFLWKQAGEPEGDHPAWKDKKAAKAQVRAAQRKQKWEERNSLRQKIAEASENDPRTFFYLIKKQKEQGASSASFIVNGDIITEDTEICDKWADYYEKLSNAEQESTENTVVLRCMRILARMQGSGLTIKMEDLDKVIKKLRPGKAADIKGIVAEQIRALSYNAKEYLLEIINKVITSGHVPEEMKVSYKLPIPKKGKDQRVMDNYRGITITSLFGKLLELICLEMGLEQGINDIANPMQCGFTRNRSPTMASLLISEAMVEAKAEKKQLFVASLDARKAFDVVNHQLLKTKCYNLDVNKEIWTVMDSIYTDGKEVIRWRGEESRQYNIKQGVKQGGTASAHLYKLYCNNLLDSMLKSRLGTFIGPVYVGTPTCADDMLLMANDPAELQAMLDICFEYAKQHQYEIHPQKSVIAHMVGSKHEGVTWKLGEEPVTKVDKFTHLGLNWESGRPTPDVQELIKSARRASYALMGVGLHGCDGMDPTTAMKTIELFIVPRLLYGLEATVLNKSQTEQLEGYYRSLLRQVQSLPENTATEAIYVLLGTIPIQARIHIRTLTLLGAIARLPIEHPIRQIAIRQLARPQSPRRSWFMHAAEIGEEYGVDIRQQVLCPWPKPVWKAYIRTVVVDTWRQRLVQNAGRKSTLHRLRHPSKEGRAHTVWTSCKGDPYLVNKATVRAKMLVGRYQVQATQAKFANQAISAVCKLCQAEEEDLPHMLTSCTALEHIRESKIQRLMDLYREDEVHAPRTREELTCAIVNGSSYIHQRPDKKFDQHEMLTDENPRQHTRTRVKQESTSDNELICKGQSHQSEHTDIEHTDIERSRAQSTSLRANREVADRLTSALCHHLHMERDICLNTQLFGGSP